jgi:hypothetical protein
MLEEQGIHVARRTVAKYREALKIAPTQLRKRCRRRGGFTRRLREDSKTSAVASHVDHGAQLQTFAVAVSSSATQSRGERALGSLLGNGPSHCGSCCCSR